MLKLHPISRQGLGVSPRHGLPRPVKNSKYGESWIRSRHFTSLRAVHTSDSDSLTQLKTKKKFARCMRSPSKETRVFVRIKM